jgi:cytochrome c biogenesis protein CcmG/thiol:disulfide interchange protein DsbE
MKRILISFCAAVLMFGSLSMSNVTAQEVAVPDVIGNDLSGKPFALNDYLGQKNLYLVFWATWCNSCRQEIPTLIDTHNNVKEVVVVGVNPGINDSLAKTKRYVEKYKIPYKIVYDETGVSAQAFGVAGVPMAILINKDGEVLYAGYPLPSEKVSEIIQSS